MKKKRRKAERTWRKRKSAEDLLVFKSLRNHVTHLCNQARRKFYLGFVKGQGGDQQKLFRATKALLTPNDEICYPNCHDKVALANDIARYFHRKILNIRNELHGIDVTKNRCGDLIDDAVFSSNLEPLCGFKELTEKDVYQLIQAAAKKSCMLDPLPTSILLGSQEELLPIITSMVNCSLFLDPWTLSSCVKSCSS